MAKKQRSAMRKARDKWRSKSWYKILAPNMFDENEIAETVTDDQEKLIGRTVQVSLMDLTGDFSKQHIKLKFMINKLRGDQALTTFRGHSLTSDYVRRLTRRKHSKMDGVFDVQTRDGYIVRVKPMAITEKRIQRSQEHVLRRLTGDTITETAERSTLSEFIKSVISGNLGKKVFRKCKPIYPIKRVEIAKTQIIKRVEGAVDIPDVHPEKEGAEEEEKTEEEAEEDPEKPVEEEEEDKEEEKVDDKAGENEEETKEEEEDKEEEKAGDVDEGSETPDEDTKE